MKDDIDEFFYRNYGDVDESGNPLVSILYVTDGLPVTDVNGLDESGRRVCFHNDNGVKILLSLAKFWGLTTD